MRGQHKGRTQEQAAASANLRSRKTVAKYERLEQLPSERERPCELITPSLDSSHLKQLDVFMQLAQESNFTIPAE